MISPKISSKMIVKRKILITNCYLKIMKSSLLPIFLLLSILVHAAAAKVDHQKQLDHGHRMLANTTSNSNSIDFEDAGSVQSSLLVGNLAIQLGDSVVVGGTTRVTSSNNNKRLIKRHGSYTNELDAARRISTIAGLKRLDSIGAPAGIRGDNQRLVFSNQTGAVVQCGVGLELARGIAAAEMGPNSAANFGHQQQPEVAQSPQIQIKWEKENGEEVEQTVFGSPAPAMVDLEQLGGGSGTGAGPSTGARPAPLLRSVRPSDGALIFEPFRAADYRPDIHSSLYRCSASSKGGSLVGRDIQVRAVLGQANANGGAQVEVNDELVIEGNSVQFKCKIPSYAQDYFQVIEWIEYPSETVLTYQSTTLQNANQLFRPAPSKQQQSQQSQHVHRRQQEQQHYSANSSFRYFISPKYGDLHILNVDTSLNYRSFRCRCKNKLTGELVSSINKGKLVVTESRDAVAPRLILDSNPRPAIVYEEGELALLACNVQSYPRAQLTWLRRLNDLDSELLLMNNIERSNKYAQVANLLLVNRVNRNDSGAYLCQVRNSIGEERLEFELQVRAPLRAKLTASATVLELGKSLALDCTVTGYPIHQVVFRHNRNIIKSISGPMVGVQQHQPTSQYYHKQYHSLHDYNGAGQTRRPTVAQLQHQQQPSGSGSYFVIEAGSETQPQSAGSMGGQQQPSGESINAPIAGDSSSSVSTETAEADEQLKLSHVIVIVLEPQHAGAYQCFAYNQHESVQSSAYIRVLDDPPKFKDTFKSEIFEQRQDVSLQCSARANPLPEITWSIDEQPIPESGRIRFGDFVTKDNLVISYVNISGTQVTDSGLYRCTADNGLAQVSHQAQISVSGPLQVKPMPNVTVVASTAFRIRCPVAGWPVGDIQWQHQGRRLPANHRQHVYENGTLEVEHMEKSQGDDGEYTCLASSLAGQQLAAASAGGVGDAAGSQAAATGSVQVSIKVRPTIEPFTVSRWLREGQRASITCTISSGDLPIAISWFLNEQPLDQHPQQTSGSESGAQLATAHQATLPRVKISRASDYSSTLLFESLLVEHSGNYSCVARNDAGSVSHQAPMIVQVAPKWSMEPADTNVVRGSSMSIDCMATGFPPPRIIWTKAGGSETQTGSGGGASNALGTTTNQLQQKDNTKSHHPNSWRSIVSSPHLQVYENGSLNILDARDSDLGYYMCQATNGVGPGLSKVIRVTINVAAQFSGRHSVQYVARGEQSQLKCQAKGDWPLVIQWTKNRSRLEPINLQDVASHHQQQQGLNQQSVLLSSSVASVLLMSPMAPSGGPFGSASQGSSLQAIGFGHLLQLDPLLVSSADSSSGLDAPKLPQQQPSSSSSSAGGGLLLDRYSMTNSLMALTKDHPALAALASGRGPGGASSATGAGEFPLELQQLNSSKFLHKPLVVQWNSMLSIARAERQDTGIFKCLTTNYFGSDERTVQLIVQEAPDRVEGLTVAEVSSRSVSLTWPAPFDGNAPIANYHIQYKPMAGGGPATGSAASSPPASLNPEAATSQAQPNNNNWSNYTLAAGSSGSQPATSNYSSSLFFDYSGHNGEGQKSAALQQMGPLMLATGSRSQVKVTIGSLRPVTRYWFRVSADNKLGHGPVSLPTEAATMEEAPGAAPTKLKAVAQSSSSVLVSWWRPGESESFGSVHGYYVAYRLATADNEIQTGTAPVGQKAQPDAGSAQQAASGGSQPSATSIFKTIPHDDKLSKFDALLTGLKRSTKYVVSVQAFNARGTGPVSEPVVVKTLDMDPPKQVKLFVKQATNCSIQIEWRPLSQAALYHQNQLLQQRKSDSGPMTDESLALISRANDQPMAMPLLQSQSDDKSTGLQQKQRLAPSQQQPIAALGSADGADIVDYYSLYQAELNERPRWQEIRLPSHTTSHTVENLHCGTRYQFYMIGVNKIGVGDQSDILDTKTAGGLPLAPDRQSTFDVINTTCFIIRLDRWQDNGCPIREFNVRYRPDSAREWTHLAHFDLMPPIVTTATSVGDQQSGIAPTASASVMDESGESKFTGKNARYGSSRVYQNSQTPGGSSLMHQKLSDQSDRYVDLRSKRSAPDEDPSEIYLFNMDEASRDDEDAFFDSASNEQAAVGGDEIGDYLAEPVNMQNAGNGSMFRLTSLSQLTEPSSQLINLLKDSMLAPDFEGPNPMAQSQLVPLDTNAPMAARQQWQANSNFVQNTESDLQAKLANRAEMIVSQTGRSNTTTSGGRNQPGGENWRRLRLCNLLDNLYYTVQISALNSVGETEAELRLLTSPEGLEFDQEIKRQVVGRLGADRSAQQVSASRDRLNMFGVEQWSILVPITLTLTLMTVIMVVAFLMKRSNSSGSTSTTTTTTTTTMGSGGGSGGGNGHSCHHGPNGFKAGPASAITEATMSSDMILGTANGLDSYTLTNGANNYHGSGGNNGNLSIYQQNHQQHLGHQQQQQQRSNQSMFGEAESAYGVVGLGSHLFNGGCATETTRSSGSPATTTAASSSLNSNSAAAAAAGCSSSQHQFNHAAMLLRSADGLAAQQHQVDLANRGRSVYLCSTLPKSSEAPGDTSGGKHEAIFYGLAPPTASQQAPLGQPIYGHTQPIQLCQYQQPAHEVGAKDSAGGSSSFLQNGQQATFHNGDLYGSAAQLEANMQQVAGDSKLDSCFLSLVEEVARANESLASQQRQASQQQQSITMDAALANGATNGIKNSLGLQQQQDNSMLLDPQAQCDIQSGNFFGHRQQPMEPSGGTNYASLGRIPAALIQEDGADGGGFKRDPSGQVTNRLMFDPVYATIRRTFPQAFRYLTLQQQHHNTNYNQQQQQFLQNQQQQLQSQQSIEKN